MRRRNIPQRLIAVVLVLIFALSGMAAAKESAIYDTAINLMVEKKYAEAAVLFDSIPDYERSSELAEYCRKSLEEEENLLARVEMLRDLVITFRPCIISLDLNHTVVLEYPDLQISEADLEADQCFGLVLRVKNQGDVSRSFSLSAECGGSNWKYPDLQTVEPGDEREYTIDYLSYPEGFDKGTHTCRWLIDDFPVIDAEYTVVEGRSVEKEKDEKILKALAAEFSIAQYSGEFSDFTEDTFLSLDDLGPESSYAPVLKLKNNSWRSVPVTLRAECGGTSYNWAPGSIRFRGSENYTLTMFKDDNRVGQFTVSYYVNSCFLGEYTFTIVTSGESSQVVDPTETEKQEPQSEEQTEILLDPEISPIEVDFEALCQRNGDVVAWLYCPDTVISYPVVQTENNMDYLHKDIDGNYSSYGTLFVECLCRKDFQDTNTVIYGHHMNDGRMFAKLVKYAKQDYYNQHPVFYLNTPEMNYRVELFSGYITDMNSHTFDVDFANAEENQAWLDSIIAQSSFSSSVEVRPGDRILTLSTCTYEYDDARFVVHGKMVPIH